MIRSLRQRHRSIWIVLLVLLPAGFVAGIAMRRDVATAPPPESLSAEPPGDWRSAGTLEQFWPELGVNAHLFDVSSTADTPPGRGIALSGPSALGIADPLLYWSATAPSGAALPADAHLLGSITMPVSPRFPLPSQATDTAGNLIVYSMGHQEVVATAPLRPAGSQK